MNRGRQYLGVALKLAFGIGILIASLQFVGFQSVFDAARSIPLFTFILALLISAIGTIAVPAIITSRTLRVSDIRISLAELIKINFAMRFYVLTLPHVITVGIRWLRYRGSRKAAGWQLAALLLFERLVQFIAIVSFGFIFLLVSFSELPGAFHFLIPVSALLSIFGVLIFLMFVSPSVFKLSKPIIDVVAKRAPNRLSSRIERFTAALNDYQKLPSRDILFVPLWTIVWYLLFILSAYIVSDGLGLDINFSDIGWMRSVVVLLTILPITVGGIGVREVGFAVLLHFYGVDPSQALAFPLILLAIQLLLGFVGAVLEGMRTISGLRNKDHVQN